MSDEQQQDFIKTLSKAEYRELENLQITYYEQGVSKDSQFVMQECWNRAVETIQRRLMLMSDPTAPPRKEADDRYDDGEVIKKYKPKKKKWSNQFSNG